MEEYHELIMQALDDAWYAMDWEDEAWLELQETEKYLNDAKTINFHVDFWEGQLEEAESSIRNARHA